MLCANVQVDATSLRIINGLSDDLTELYRQNQNNNNSGDDDDDGLSGGIIALIVILVLLGVLVPVVIVIVYVLYKRKYRGQFNIFRHHRGYGANIDYIADNTAINPGYASGQELQTSQVQEMVSSEPEPSTDRLVKDDSDSDEPDSDSTKNLNIDVDSDKDTRL